MHSIVCYRKVKTESSYVRNKFYWNRAGLGFRFSDLGLCILLVAEWLPLVNTVVNIRWLNCVQDTSIQCLLLGTEFGTKQMLSFGR